MADIFCPNCGEPWDMDCLHDEVKERFPNVDVHNEQEYRKKFNIVSREFRTKGCVALAASYGTTQCEARPSMRTLAASALSDVMGDDIDGIASGMEDFEQLGLL